MRRQQLQIQKQVSKKDYRLFLETIARLERYIEISGYYWNWENRKWIHDNTIKRKDIIGDSEKAEELFSNQLFILSKNLEDMPTFFREELKEDFYRWVDTTGINADNCPSKLKHFLFGFNEVLEGHSEKVQSKMEKGKSNLNSVTPEYTETKMFSIIQTPLREERENEWSRGGRFFYQDLKLKNKLSADAEQGKEAFEQIAKTADWWTKHSFTKKKYQSSSIIDPYQIIQRVNQNLQNWRLDEIPTEIDEFGRAKKQEFVLIHRSAHENDFWRGKLNFSNNPIYKWKIFNARQRLEIKKALNIRVDYLTEEEIKWVFKEDPRDWKVGKIEGQTYLIHNSARIRKEEIGTLIHSQQKFSEAEWSEVEKVLKNCFLTKKKSNFVSFANKDYNIKDQDDKEDKKEKKWFTCKANSCDNEPDYWVDYCSYHQKCLDKLQKYKSNISNIEALETFETWFNGNCGYVICQDYNDGYYQVFLVVYEPEKKDGNKVVIPENLQAFPKDKNCNCWGIYKRDQHSTIEKAQEEAEWLRGKLNEENPILAIHPYANKYENFYWITYNPYVTKYEVGRYSDNTFYWPNNLDSHINPLSVIRVKKEHKTSGKEYYHIGVYMGNNEVFHIYDWKKQAKYMKSRIDDIKTFLADTENTRRVGHYIEVHRPIIPFRDWKKTIRNIVWAKNAEYWDGRYCLANRNCEHLTNMMVYGINYSKQVAESPTWSRIACKFTGSNCFSNGGCGDFKSNNGKGSTICLRNEIKEVNDKLGESCQMKELEARIEVPLKKENCRIM